MAEWLGSSSVDNWVGYSGLTRADQKADLMAELSADRWVVPMAARRAANSAVQTADWTVAQSAMNWAGMSALRSAAR